MTHWFVGQKVCCIDDSWGSNKSWPIRFLLQFKALPNIGNVYVIRRLQIMGCGQLGFYLEGFGNELLFAAHCFRPLVEKSTDISIFTSLLDRLPSEQLEDV